MRRRNTQNMIWKTFMVAFALLATPGFAQDGDVVVGQEPQNLGVDGREITCTVTGVTGDAMYRPSAEAPWQAIEVGQVLPVGTEIRTGLRDNVQLALGPNADVTIERLSRVIVGRLEKQGDSIRTLLGVQNGKVDFHVKKVGFVNDFKVATPTGTMAVEGTQGQVIVDDQTNITGDPNNTGNAINFGQNNTGKKYALTGNDEYDDSTGEAGSNNNNSNTGDGNGNGGDNNPPETDSLHGNDSFMNDMQQFENDVKNNGGLGGGGGGGDL